MSSMNIMLWNQKDLPRPPINTCKALTEDLDLLKLRNTLQDGIKHFKDDEFLTNEAAILSRMLYRMKTKFRSAKEFKLMEKLNRSLNIYFKTNVCRDLQNILEMTPTRYEKDTYLPTKNILQYVLVRLQGLAKLMERMYDMCLIIASELNQRICIGHFWKMFILLFAVVSRISILLKFNTKFMCDLYGKLLSYSYKLINTGKNWLPKGYDLPSDLRTWLSVQWVNEDDFVDLTFEPTNEIMNFFNLIDDDDDDVLFCDEYIMLDVDNDDKQIVHDFNKLSPLKEIITRNRMRGFSINEDDIGEEITDVIELNDSVYPKESEKDAEYNLNNMEDFGEEIHVTNNSNTTLSSQEKSNNECRNNSNEDNICENKTLPDLIEGESYSEYDVINDDNMNIEENSVIVLDEPIIDTKVKKSNKKKKFKSQNSLKETVEATGEEITDVIELNDSVYPKESEKDAEYKLNDMEDFGEEIHVTNCNNATLSSQEKSNNECRNNSNEDKICENKTLPDLIEDESYSEYDVINDDNKNIEENSVIVLDEPIINTKVKKSNKKKKSKSQNSFKETVEATGEEITDAIELNDSEHPKKSEKDAEYKLNGMQDFGEDIHVANNNTTLSSQGKSNNNCRNNSNEDKICENKTLPDLIEDENYSEYNVINNDNMNIEENSVIVLDEPIIDTKVKQSNKKKKKSKSNKPQYSFKETVEATGQKSQKKKKNKQHNTESTKVAIKRKLHFDEPISNKKLKTVVNISLNEGVSNTPAKRKLVKKKDSDIDNKNEAANEKVIDNDAINIEQNRNVIVLDDSVVYEEIQNTGKKRRKAKKNKSQDPFEENVEATGQKSQKKKKNKQHSGESTKVAIKRKLHFDEPMSNKELKTVVNISLNEGVSDTPTKRKLVKKKNSDIDNSNEAAKEKVIDNYGLNIEQNRSIIVLDDSIIDKKVQNTGKKRRKAKKNKSQDSFKKNVSAKNLKSPKKTKDKKPKHENSNKKLKTLVNISKLNNVAKVQNTKKKRKKSKKNKSHGSAKHK